jgi:hypothetical protein
MNQLQIKRAPDEERLGGLAMKFRGSQGDTDRQAIAAEYSQAVHRLIRSGTWNEMPAPEDQLPDSWMPREFSEYWFPRSTGA